MNSNTLLEKLDKILSPIGAKVGNQIHLKSISNGMMMTLPLIVVGSIFLILANPPVNPDLVNPETANIFMKFMLSWKEFAVDNYQTLTTPYNMTMGIVGMMSAFAIAYCLASEYKMKASISGLISTAMFLMICAPSVDGAIATNFLGADGLFIAIIIGLSSVEVTRFVESNGWQFKFPDTVPPAVTAFVNSLLPLLLNIIVLYGINILIISNIGISIPEAIMKVLTPALSVVDNIWGYLAIITLGNVLWLLGVNGTSIIFPIVFALGIQNTGINADLVAKGQDPSVIMNLQMFRFAILGGAGNTLGLTLLMMKSKSAHLKSLGRLGIVPGVCGINEPIIFGGPIVFNPILAIPFIVTPIITVGLGYLAQVMGLITPGYLVDPSFTPFFAQAYFSSMDWRNVLFVFGLVILSIVIYYPFFKIYEKNMLAQEGVSSDFAA
ncbi:MAG TPA: PTS transporter subunit EIIC [Romboutsia timonensis]|uniref:Permease IIC component n=1 Tax=Romboutsia timonensis TaxID=1776391 RepID=A0A921MYN6_9FIRM|nr:PTS transporter subunit EIIC [uncultured Romboutsia sp.]HJG95503.1 PTS transporter subunit EIIC [Romboutsia timonensis]